MEILRFILQKIIFQENKVILASFLITNLQVLDEIFRLTKEIQANQRKRDRKNEQAQSIL